MLHLAWYLRWKERTLYACVCVLLKWFFITKSTLNSYWTDTRTDLRPYYKVTKITKFTNDYDYTGCFVLTWVCICAFFLSGKIVTCVPASHWVEVGTADTLGDGGNSWSHSGWSSSFTIYCMCAASQISMCELIIQLICPKSFSLLKSHSLLW